MHELFTNNDTAVRLTGLKDDVSGETITDATVTFTLVTLAGAEITTGSLTHDNNGDYTGSIESDTNLEAGTTYKLTIQAAASNGRAAAWVRYLTAQERNT